MRGQEIHRLTAKHVNLKTWRGAPVAAVLGLTLHEAALCSCAQVASRILALSRDGCAAMRVRAVLCLSQPVLQETEKGPAPKSPAALDPKKLTFRGPLSNNRTEKQQMIFLIEKDEDSDSFRISDFLGFHCFIGPALAA